MKYLFEMMDHLDSTSDIQQSFRDYITKHRPNYCQDILNEVGPDGLTMFCVGAEMIIEIIQLQGVPVDLDEICTRVKN